MGSSRKKALRDAAAYILDRAEQYETDSGCYTALAEVAHNIMLGEVDASVADGALEPELYDRVDKMAGTRAKPRPVNPTLGVDLVGEAELECKIQSVGFEPWSELRSPRYNGSGEPCDMWTGPCCCGATHNQGV